MSEELGSLTFGRKEEQVFLGREFTQYRDYNSSEIDELIAGGKKPIPEEIEAGTS
jgi:cell division protease FtsH